MGKYYLSKNYKSINDAGNKAKTDIERIMYELGYLNAGLPQSFFKNKIASFFLTLIGVLKVPFTVSKGDILVLQYPLKKFYPFVCRMAHWRGCKVVTLIHDLGSFRRKKLTIPQEIKKLSASDVLIVHNTYMKQWLTEQGYAKPMVCLEIFDYLSDTVAAEARQPGSTYRVTYAGGLSYKKNRFIYDVDPIVRTWIFNLYGGGFESDRIKGKDLFVYKGFVPSDQLIATAEGDFGLVWDGESPLTCAGAFGEYLQYNNPHKTSLYIRCHLPVIVWGKAAIASFIRENHIGICVDSLEHLDDILSSVTQEQYAVMKENCIRISERLASGFYTQKALETACRYLKD